MAKTKEKRGRIISDSGLFPLTKFGVLMAIFIGIAIGKMLYF
jgi:hypothetical protein